MNQKETLILGALPLRAYGVSDWRIFYKIHDSEPQYSWFHLDSRFMIRHSNKIHDSIWIQDSWFLQDPWFHLDSKNPSPAILWFMIRNHDSFSGKTWFMIQDSFSKFGAQNGANPRPRLWVIDNNWDGWLRIARIGSITILDKSISLAE